MTTRSLDYDRLRLMTSLWWLRLPGSMRRWQTNYECQRWIYYTETSSRWRAQWPLQGTVTLRPTTNRPGVVPSYKHKQVAQLSQRPHCKGRDQSCPKWKTIFCRHYRSIFNHCDIIGIRISRIRWNNVNKGYYEVQGHSRSPMYATFGHPISYRFEVIADYCSNFGRTMATVRFRALFGA